MKITKITNAQLKEMVREIAQPDRLPTFSIEHFHDIRMLARSETLSNGDKRAIANYITEIIKHLLTTHNQINSAPEFEQEFTDWISNLWDSGRFDFSIIFKAK